LAEQPGRILVQPGGRELDRLRLHLLVPGYVTFAADAAGPILWILAAVFTTIGILQPAASPQREVA
jgi:hypothetical protein